MIAEKIQATGLHASHRGGMGTALIQVRAEYVRAAREPSTSMRGAELESLRADGLVTGTQIAAAFGCEPGAVTHAVERHQLTPVKWEPFGDERGMRPLFDAARLAVRKDGQKGPVDVGSKLAAQIDVPAK